MIHMIHAEDWLVELAAKITGLERDLGIDPAGRRVDFPPEKMPFHLSDFATLKRAGTLRDGGVSWTPSGEGPASHCRSMLGAVA